MIRFWANFAKSGKPGESTNSIKWDSIVKDGQLNSSFIVLDNKKNLRIEQENKTLKNRLLSKRKREVEDQDMKEQSSVPTKTTVAVKETTIETTYSAQALVRIYWHTWTKRFIFVG